jgi:hypothetical protein
MKNFVLRILPLILAALISIAVKGQTLEQRFLMHPELYVRVKAESPLLRSYILGNFYTDPDPISEGSLVINLTSGELAEFLALGLEYEVVETDRNPDLFPVSDFMDRFSAGITAYPSYDAYEAMMYAWEQNYPALCKTYNLGTLPSGRKILAVRLSKNVAVSEPEPSFLYTGTIHGDETAGYVILLNLIDTLLSSYGSNPEFTAILDSFDLWINPLSNPDGTYHGGNNNISQAARRNANSVDLNRNYPDPEDGPHPDGLAWQPETMIFMGLADTLPFTMAANFHGGAEVVNYPWDTWSQFPADNGWWVMVSNEYADTCQFFGPSGYMNDFGTGVTNGYAWYTIDGGRQDYMNYFHHCREVTLEISNTKLIPANQLQNFINYNFRSVINYLKQVGYGLHGTVRDSATGLPLRARVLIQGHDIDSSHVWSQLPGGRYHRLLHAGNYPVTFSADGYHSKTILVNISNYQQTYLEVSLIPAGIGIDDQVSSGPAIIIYPNPALDLIHILWADAKPRPFRLFDSSGRVVLESSPGQNESSLDISRLPKGFYMFESEGIRQRLIKH